MMLQAKYTIILFVLHVVLFTKVHTTTIFYAFFYVNSIHKRKLEVMLSHELLISHELIDVDSSVQ